jgi:hypothetical protein
MNNHTIFILAKGGRVKGFYSEERKAFNDHLKDGWKHTTTTEPRDWIERLMNNGEDPSDLMDEFNFGSQL